MSDEQPAAAAPEWPRTIKLKHPVSFDEMITELVFQRGKLANLKGIKLVPGEVALNDLVTIASRLCGQPAKVIEQLDPDDAQEVLSIALYFYGKCLAGIAQ